MCRENPHSIVDLASLSDDALTAELQCSVEVTAQVFQKRGEAGTYLHSILDSTALTRDDIMSNIGLWSWLSLFFFDSICPSRENKGRRVNSDYYYIYDRKRRDYYRHLLYVSWRIQNLAGNHHRLFTTARIDTIDKVTDRVMGNLTLIRIPCIFEVLDRLYWDEKSQDIRKKMGSTKTHRGNLLHRFPAVIEQLEMTYDLQSLNADQLIDLLGDEFDFSVH
jgi:hypothetical protein